ncbi:MAG: GMC family oxidoreductase [Rhodospirillales bacterium]|nr:GMC family oxidoreductase [Rhodospirillales bacterium]
MGEQSGHDYDVIVIGSGAGGAAVAFKLARAGKRVLVLEKGQSLPRDGSTLDVKQVFREGRFKNMQMWVDGYNKQFVPGEFYNVGGKTKWYGAALLRFSPHEFEADAAHQCLGWPFGYEELEPWYDEAERLMSVNHFDNEPELQALIDRITNTDPAWRVEALPLGLKREILGDEQEAKHFDGYASACGYKSDAEWNLIDPVRDAPGFSLLAGKQVVSLQHAPHDPAIVTGVVCADGTAFAAKEVVLAAGAMSAPRILQDYLAETGLDAALPCAPLVGCNFKFHINSALLGFGAFRDHDVLRKTAIFFNEAFAHSTVQCLGWIDGEILATQLPAAVPKFVTKAVGERAIGFFVTTEDGSDRDNRILSGGAGGLPVMNYDLRRLKPADKEHRRLVRAFMVRLARAGLIGVDRYVGMAGTAHALGTLVTGSDPLASVVDANGRVHGMQGLWVGDGSVLPRASRVNPALTIYAWGLRLGARLAQLT